MKIALDPDMHRHLPLTEAPVPAHVHIADTFNHKATSGLRYIVNPPG